MKCHTFNTSTGPGARFHELHTLIGGFRADAAFRCVNCHMDLTGKTGARTLSASDANHQYFDNDIRDHSFIMPRRDNPGVKNYTLADDASGKAMPIPYTRACGTCHRLSSVTPAP